MAAGSFSDSRITRKTTGVEYVCATEYQYGVVEIAPEEAFLLDSSKKIFINKVLSKTGAYVVPTTEHLRESELRSKEYAESLFTSSLNQSSQDISSDSSNINWNPSNGTVLNLTLTKDATLKLPNPLLSGIYHLIVKQDAIGSHTLLIDSGYTQLSPITILSTANKITILKIVSDGSSVFIHNT